MIPTNDYHDAAVITMIPTNNYHDAAVAGQIASVLKTVRLVW